MIELQDLIVEENVELTASKSENEHLANLVSSLVDRLNDNYSSLSSTLTKSESSELSICSLVSSGENSINEKDDTHGSNLKKLNKSEDVVKSVKFANDVDTVADVIIIEPVNKCRYSKVRDRNKIFGTRFIHRAFIYI